MSPEGPGPRLTRRRLLVGGAVVGTAAVAATAGGVVAAASSAGDTGPRIGDALVPFHGEHQAGVTTPPQAHALLVALDLDPATGRDGLLRLMRLWTSDAERLTQGTPALADTEPALAERPARLTVTLGVGPGAVRAAGREADAPDWLQPLPAFAIDDLQDAWSHGDLLLQVCGDDLVAVSHAVRVLVRNARSYTSVRWVQRGFREAAGSLPDGATGRNLMGQLDGTVNPRTPQEFTDLVWAGDGGPTWLRGGTGVVVRRIRMDLDRWDLLSFRDKDAAMGRRLSDGAPLSGGSEHDDVDLAAVDGTGLPAIPRWAHVRRARGEASGPQFLRRGYNYDEGLGADGAADAGLIFVAFSADVGARFVPVQRRLSELDLLNMWTTPIGSAVFAILPGVAGPGDVLARALLDA